MAGERDNDVDDDDGFDDLELLTGAQLAAESAAAGGAGDAGSGAGSEPAPAAAEPAPSGGATAAAALTAGDQTSVSAAAAAERSFALRNVARAAGYEYGDDDDDGVVLRDFGAALEEVRSYQSPEFQARLQAAERYQQFGPAFEAWYQAQGQGGAAGQAPGPAQGGAGPAALSARPTQSAAGAAPAAADPNDPFAAWANVPEYAPEWENVCAWNPQLGRYVFRQEVVAEMQKYGAIPDQSIPQKLTAYKQWEANHGREVIRNLPKLLEAHAQRQYDAIEKRILEKVGGRESEREAERRLQAVVAADIGDYFETDANTGQILRGANGALVRKPLGHFFHNRSVEAQQQFFPEKNKQQLTAGDKIKIHNYAKQMAHADYLIWQAQQGNQGGSSAPNAAAPAAAAPQPSAAAPATPAASKASAAAPAQQLPPNDPQRGFLDGAMEEARGQSSAAGGREANLRRSQNADDEDDDDHDFSDGLDETPRQMISRLRREAAQAAGNGFARR